MKVKEFIKYHTEVMQYKRYCEIVISPDGNIEYAIPSHVYKLMNIAKETKEQLDKMMPNRAAPLYWLCEHLGYCSCWYAGFIIPVNYTPKQIAVLKELMNGTVMSNDITGELTMEKTLCNRLDQYGMTGDKSLLEDVFSTKPFSIKEV